MDTLDHNELIEAAQKLGDQINDSMEVQRYLQLKQLIYADQDALQLIHSFDKVKTAFEETKRFGIFHPNYHEAKENMELYRDRLQQHPLIGEYLALEDQIEQLLFQVSHLIARAVSKEVKVPHDTLDKRRRQKGT
jgi:cell fate (sporulation/competence/biofilm development) regulator YlbF (YheA/YmcA/DUF963 family)